MVFVNNGYIKVSQKFTLELLLPKPQKHIMVYKNDIQTKTGEMGYEI